MASPVLQALQNARVAEEREQELTLNVATCAHLGVPVPTGSKSREWSVWKAFCDKQRITALPALPAAVAVWILNHGHLGETVVKVVESIGTMHASQGLSDPTRSDIVIAALAKVAPVKPPRGWDAAARLMFARLPRDVATYIHKREADRDKAVRQAQNSQNRKDKPQHGHSQSAADTTATDTDAQRAH